LLRALIGRYLETEPDEVSFLIGKNGKPTVRDNRPVRSRSPAARLHFSLSHSRHVALYAFTEIGPVGVDVEAIARRKINELAVAERVLGPAVRRRLGEFDAVARRREFLRAWTQHEAERKRSGVGLRSDRVMDEDGAPAWSVDLALGPACVAAVAVSNPPTELCCWVSA
jgi:4'-phosphopantetheinyl transferase